MDDLVEINKRLNPFKPMIDDDMLKQSANKLKGDAYIRSRMIPTTAAASKGPSTGAKVAAGGAGVLGTAAAVGGGIWAARKVAQARAAKAIEQRAAQVAAAKAANFKRTAMIGGGTLAGAAAAPTAYKMYREKQGG